MHLTKPGRALFLLSVVSLVAIAACGIAIKRDLSTIPQGQVGFEDMCGLQEYFDSLEAGVAKEPTVVDSVELEGGDGVKTVRGGRARIAFEGMFLLKNGKRVLKENWRRLPEELDKADRFDIEVYWAEKASVRRVVTNREADLFIGKDVYPLPYHVCLSELLYGAPLYKQRRTMWGLPDPKPVAKPVGLDEATLSALAADGAASDASVTDGGAAPETR